MCLNKILFIISLRGFLENIFIGILYLFMINDDDQVFIKQNVDLKW